ncbi:prepilin peptidase [Levilactobacillus enshiensis]|uniref:prepilin peptidase n=1 Tax=Levilactobacillus enshiensis TaxID=2590213 RepID=UPI00117BB1E1|nr:A24 family peptidase [Levilactobacillus enshiensis]
MLIILFIYGACLGSGLVALADRYATHTSFFYPASHCDTCQTPLTYWQLVPILSYLLLRGRCHYCQTAIPATGLLVEFTAGMVLTTLTPATVIPVIWLGLWSYAALCDAQTKSFPGWVSYFSLLLTLYGHSFSSWLVAALLVVLINWLCAHWVGTLIGNGDLDMLLTSVLLWHVTDTAKLLLLACVIALLRHSKETRLAFIPYLIASSLFWWFWSW